MSDADEIKAGKVADSLASRQAEEREEQQEAIKREQTLIDRLVAALSTRKRGRE
jgi:hypothetical protein